MWNKNIQTNNLRRGGFTLIEVITALSIIMVGIAGAYALVNQTLMAAGAASMQLTAAYLGKEGIEIVKNIRDSNYLKTHYSVAGYDSDSWTSGLTSSGTPVSVDCSSGCDADYSMEALDQAYASQPLNFNNDFFNHSAASPTNLPTPYKRIITVTPDSGSDYLNVAVRIEWTERGRSHSLEVQENLYNWWPQ